MNTLARARFEQPQFDQLEVEFDYENAAYWLRMNPFPRPCFNEDLLVEIRRFIDGLRGTIPQPAGYVVLASQIPGIFNLGGDLEVFREAIKRRDAARLRHYARLCVDDLYPWHCNFDLPVTTISLVQGDALGGGLEAALASTYVIAEESARLGFPEVLFNLFPGMGAYSFLRKKVGRRIADRLITSGNLYSAQQLFDLGVVDAVAPDGEGEEAVSRFIRQHSRSANGRRAYEQVCRDIDALTREELEAVAEIWVQAALRLTERDLRMMERLVRAQHNRSAMPDYRPTRFAGGAQLEAVANI